MKKVSELDIVAMKTMQELLGGGGHPHVAGLAARYVSTQIAVRKAKIAADHAKRRFANMVGIEVDQD